jgi:hypothetical protein
MGDEGAGFVYPEMLERDGLAERDLARDRFEASQAPVKDLARRRLEAIRQSFQARYNEFLAGRGTLDLLLEVQALLAAAQQRPSKPAGINRQALEEKWRFSWVAYQLSRGGYETGRVRAVDYYYSHFNLLDVEVQLALTRHGKK